MHKIAHQFLCQAFIYSLTVSLLQAADQTSILQITIEDTSGSPLPCRIHLLDQQGEAVKPKDLPFWQDHFVCPGRAELSLKPGNYKYLVERGPEYQRESGSLVVRADKQQQLQVTLHRLTYLRQQGWYSGDLHVHRQLQDVPLLMQAEDLDFAPVITWWNTRNLWKDEEVPQTLTRNVEHHRIYNIMAGEDEREGGALLYFGLRSPLDIAAKNREYPSPMQFVQQARTQADIWIDIEKPFWWDVPVWLASGNMNSIGIANNHMCHSSVYPDEAWGRPRDTNRLPSPHGNGYWTQEIYYHMLNTGLRLPPSAGSASGVLPNPVGYNRAYVYLDEPFTRETWFQGLAAGRSFLTNGPILLVTANQSRPGNIFKLSKGEKQTIQLEIQLASQDPIAKLELIHNGKTAATIPYQQNQQTLTHEFHIDSSGWFLVRAITDVKETFRFATTAPWFIESEEQPTHISRSSAKFFLDWTNERIARITKNMSDEEKRAEVLKWHHQAKTFWQQRLSSANAD